jgi:hypothetical protein
MACGTPCWPGFPEVEFKSVALAFSQLIMKLSHEEIAVVRHAANIGDDMVRAMVVGRHLAYLGGTVIVGEDEAIELNPYTSRILRAESTVPVR